MLYNMNEYNKNELIERMRPYKKLDVEVLKTEDFEMKEYFYTMKLNDVRTKFAIDNKMVNTIKSDFPSDPTYFDQLWTFPELK